MVRGKRVFCDLQDVHNTLRYSEAKASVPGASDKLGE